MARENTPVIQVGDRTVETPELLAYLLSLANDFRRANGGDPLEEIPPSRPGIPQDCIIANALNFDSLIFPATESSDAEPRAAFTELEHAERFAKLTGAHHVIDRGAEDEEYLGEWRWEVKLTPELNAIALAFDKGLLAELESDASIFNHPAGTNA